MGAGEGRTHELLNEGFAPGLALGDDLGHVLGEGGVVGEEFLEALVVDLGGADVGLALTVAVRGWPVRAETSPKTPPTGDVAEVDFAGVGGAHDGVDGAGKNEEKGVAGIVLAVEDLAGGELEIGGVGGEFLLEFGGEGREEGLCEWPGGGPRGRRPRRRRGSPGGCRERPIRGS